MIIKQAIKICNIVIWMLKIKIDSSAGCAHKNDSHLSIILKMIFRFFLLATVVSAGTLDPTSENDLKLKLGKYQATTGIDDAKTDEIWKETMRNSKISIFYPVSNLISTFSSLSRIKKL